MPEQSFSPEPAEQQVEHKFSRSSEILRTVQFANHNSEWYRKNEQLRHQQETVISNLPENFLDRIEEHLNRGREEARRHDDRKFNDFNYSIGEVFEILIEIEDELFDLFPGVEKIPQTEEEKHAAQLLLDIMHDPTKYGLMQTAIANPDLVKLSIENGTFVIKDATEAKTHLDRRSFRQLGRNGFKKSFQMIIDEVNEMDDPSKFGLEEFATLGINLDVALQYIQKLALPRDLGTTEEDIKRGLENRPPKDHMTDYELSEFARLINTSGDVVIGRSSFSRTELRNITQWALGEILSRQSKKTIISPNNS